ncbi:MAG: molecular chaperone DnaJ [Gammaproteobacteria bacterium]|nr:MAG: molecular chaperone DnaJ [Gammaproteobacteria bacterium]
MALVAAVYFLIVHLRSLPKEKRNRTALNLVFTLLVVAVIVLSLTGRIHWIGAALTGLLVALRQFGPALLKLMPAFSLWQQHKAKQTPPPPSPDNKSLSRAEALSILGLSDPVTEEDIVAAHRSLMQKLHPDRGGNDYLAAQLNRAKDTLLS